MPMVRVVPRRSPPNQPVPSSLASQSAVLSALFIAMCAGTLWAQSVINTVAGGGSAATSLGPGLITGIVVDQSGNVFLLVSDRSVVMRLDAATGSLTTVVGTGIAGFSGDGGPATSAKLSGPLGLALDSSGNLYIADTGNNRVRRVSNGTITTAAGNGSPGNSGDGGLATNASIGDPLSVALDAAGNVYIGQSTSESHPGLGDIRKVSGGVISTLGFVDVAISIASDGAGDIFAPWPETGSIEELTSVSLTFVNAGALNEPHGVAVDASGNLYIADSANNRVRKLSNGTVSTIAGNGTAGSSGDGGPATSAELDSPLAVAVDAAGNVYIVESGQRVRKVSAADATISTLVGTGASGSSGDGGAATNTELMLSNSVALDSSGNLYISEAGSHRIRKVSNGIISTVAGNGTQGYGGDGGSATSAQLNNPTGLTVTPSGDLYIADTGNSAIRKVSNGTISTVAGNGTQGYSGDNGPATNAELKFPVGVAVDSAGNLFIADTGNWVIRKVSGGTISTFFGKLTCCSTTPLHGPSGLAFDNGGNLYVADAGNDLVRKISSNGTISTVAGLANWTWCCAQRGYNGDNGSATMAELWYPVSVAVDASGSLYIADAVNQRIRKVSNGVITTVVGNGAAGFSGDAGAPASAQLTYPSGVAVDGNGNLYIADVGNKRIRAVSVAPTIGSVSPSTTYAGAPAFTLTVNGTNFQTGSLVDWNGAALNTTFVSATQLTASAPANLIANVGIANVTVVNAQSASSIASSFSIVAPFSLSANPTLLTISRGGNQTSTINIPPASGFSGTVTVSCSVAYNGQGTATAPPSCSLNAAQVSVTSPNTGNTTLNVATTAAQQATARTNQKGLGRLEGIGLLLIAVVVTAGCRRRNVLALFLMLALVCLLVLLPACGGGGNGGGGGGSGGTTTGSYTVTVTATSGSYSTNVGIPLTVQ
jgi:sugar lactone lactonase YvrE